MRLSLKTLMVPWQTVPALHFFAGRTNQAAFGIRRGLIRFDVAAALPENALIDRVSLSLYQNSNNVEPSAVSLHRVLTTGVKVHLPAAVAAERLLKPVMPPGCIRSTITTSGCRKAGISSPMPVPPNGRRIRTFTPGQSTVNLVNDVRLWLHAPQQNFGWLVMGDEDTAGVGQTL